MNDPKKMSREQLEEHVQKLSNVLNRSIKIENKLAGRLAQKEQEIAILSVQLDDVSRGFEALKKKYGEDNKNEPKRN